MVYSGSLGSTQGLMLKILQLLGHDQARHDLMIVDGIALSPGTIINYNARG